MSYPYIMQGDSITIVIDSVAHTINRSHIAYDKLREAIRTSDWDIVPNLVAPAKAIELYAQGNVVIREGEVFWQGSLMHNAMTQRMLEMLREGFDIQPMVNFMHNLMNNPSRSAVMELYEFLEKCNLPITPDGYFLAFKRVNHDFTDVHSGTVLYKPADMMTDDDHKAISEMMGKKGEVSVDVVDGITTVSTERFNVDDIRTNTCSAGLHFCSKNYLNHFGGSVIVILKINPANVVSIPVDYDHAKGRACAFQVVGVLEGGTDTIGDKPVDSRWTRDDEEEYEYFDKEENEVDYDDDEWDELDELEDDDWNDDEVDGAAHSWPSSADMASQSPVQEYNKNGRPLSMTKNAIRKRAKAAAERASQNKTSQKKVEPTIGSTEYIRGYSDGYFSRSSLNPGNSSSYSNGFSDGEEHRDNGHEPHFAFEVPLDKNGRLLSMTNDAIRKRVKRAEGR